MMKRIYFIFMFLLFTLISYPFNLKVIVKDINNVPINNARIFVKELNKTYKTNNQGKINVKISEEKKKVHLEITKNEFMKEKINVKLPTEKYIEVFLIPQKLLNTRITVTATNYKEELMDIPVAESELTSLEVKEDIPINTVDSITNSLGVYFVGKGGFTVTPSIRGLAKRRVLVLYDNARVVSDRNAGVSATLIPPQFIQKIEIIRSPISVMYGSDAIGGVLNIITRKDKFDKENNGMINLSLKYPSNRVNSGITYHSSIGGFQVDAGFEYMHRNNYYSPETEIYNSSYEYFTGRLNISKKTENEYFYLTYLDSNERDIGKPSRSNSQDSKKYYPYRNNNFLHIGYNNKSFLNGEIKLLAFLNPYHYKLEKIYYDKNSLSSSEHSSLNNGFKAIYNRKLSKNLLWQTGIDYFGRDNMDIKNSEYNDSKGKELDVSFYSIKNGERKDYSIYTSLDYSGLKNFDIIAGARYSSYKIQALNSNSDLKSEKSLSKPNFYFGITRRFGKKLSIFSSLGTGHRIPTIIETFYSGITGRGDTIENLELSSEKSLNIDGGIKFNGNNIFIGLYAFSYQINDIIEKFDLTEDISQYRNLDNGNIEGLEAEFQFLPTDNLEISGNYYIYKGKSENSEYYLNDIPPTHLFLKVKYWYKRFFSELNFIHASDKDNPGPAEMQTDSFNVLNLKLGYYYSKKLFIFSKISNLTNELYYPNPDPKIPPAPCINASLGIHYIF